MSRSYREPFYTDGYKGSKRRQLEKNLANRHLRRKSIDEDLPNGKGYRKYSDPYNICDFKFKWDPFPRVFLNYRTHEFELVYPEKPWRVFRK
jgi:hypothetical protein